MAHLIQMPFWVVSGVGHRTGVLDGGCDRQREETVLGVNLGHPILVNGDFVASCAEVCKLIELSFGVVSGVSGGMGVSGEVHVPQREGEVLGFWISIGLNAVFV